ncbi:helix-turn-helix domain-containing protein, partial [Streptomyces sp. SBT349]|uniref:helix-turn-helix domain-containing protein n=1 Tax=Streptomyces sp. SBT349 TaxID=1580539 RepID=UPI00066CF133
MTQNHSGRPKQYCGKRCRDAAYRAGRAAALPEASRYAAYVRRMSEDLARKARALLAAALSENPEAEVPLTVLRLADELDGCLNDVRAAAVQQARTRRARTADIARAMNLTPVQLRTHWSAGTIERRMVRRETLAARRGEAMARPLAATARGPAAGGAVGRAGSADAGPPGQGRRPPPLGHADSGLGPFAPERGVLPLACALSTLQRASGRTLRDVGRHAGVSASYVSRVLAGKRRPSWLLTRRLVESCDGDPSDVLPLWHAARGQATRPPIPEA